MVATYFDNSPDDVRDAEPSKHESEERFSGVMRFQSFVKQLRHSVKRPVTTLLPCP